MKDNKTTFLALLFALFCLALIGGVYYLGTRLKELQEQYDDLSQRKANLKSTTDDLENQIKVFSDAFAQLSNYQINPASSDMAFYSAVQQAVQDNGVVILSTRQQGVNKEGLSTIAMTLRGNYYSLMQTLAAWRNLPMTVRMASLIVRADKSRGSAASPGNGVVQADMTLEAVIAGQ